MTFGEIAVYWFFITLILMPLWTYLLYKLFKSCGFKRWYMKHIKRKRWTDVIFIDKDNMPLFDVCEVVTHGAREYIESSGEKYGYEPIAVQVAILQEGNAIPYCTGGYVEEKVQKDALKDLKIESTPEKLQAPSNSEDEKNIERVYKWVISHMSNKLKKCIIRPYVKWSASELYDAIQSKVVQELVRIPLDTTDIILLLVMGITIIVTVYFGYTNMQLLQQIADAISKSPYTPTVP